MHQATTAATLCAIHNVAEMGSPQQKIILAHLRERRDAGLSQFEALHLYRVAALPRRIADLEAAGVPIRRERREDPTGRAYVRYYLEV
jgi:hypothetical protein